MDLEKPSFVEVVDVCIFTIMVGSARATDVVGEGELSTVGLVGCSHIGADFPQGVVDLSLLECYLTALITIGFLIRKRDRSKEGHEQEKSDRLLHSKGFGYLDGDDDVNLCIWIFDRGKKVGTAWKQSETERTYIETQESSGLCG